MLLLQESSSPKVRSANANGNEDMGQAELRPAKSKDCVLCDMKSSCERLNFSIHRDSNRMHVLARADGGGGRRRCCLKPSVPPAPERMPAVSVRGETIPRSLRVSLIAER